MKPAESQANSLYSIYIHVAETNRVKSHFTLFKEPPKEVYNQGKCKIREMIIIQHKEIWFSLYYNFGRSFKKYTFEHLTV
jgi:hypothetical protein